MRDCNFAICGSNLTKLYQATCREAGVISYVQFLEEVPPTKFGRAKKVQHSARLLTTVDVSANNSGIYRHNVNLKSICITQPVPRWGLKFGELWSINKKVIGAHVDPPNWTFSGDYISALTDAVTSNFYTFYNPLKCISSRTWGAGRPQVGLCSIFLVNFLR